jgi:hypothetical protein
VAKTTPIPGHVLPLSKARIASARILSTTVVLGWDRATYFLVLNSAILSVATGLLKLDNPSIVYMFVAILFAFGCAISSIGSKSITTAHEYYRRTVVKKTVIEERLGLHGLLPDMHQSLNLAIGTTRGHSERMKILSDPEAWVARPHRRTTITFWLRWIFRGMAVVDAAGFVIVLGILFERWKHIGPLVPLHWAKPLF